MQCEKTASQLLFNLETIVTDPEPESLGSSGSGSVMIRTDPDSFISKRKQDGKLLCAFLMTCYL